MKKLLIALILVAIIAAAWFLLPRPTGETPSTPPPPIEVPESVEPPAPEPEAEVVEPPASESEELLPPAPSQPSLPLLQQSDDAVVESADEVIQAPQEKDLLVTDNVIPRIVATVDALTARQVPGKLLPLQPPDSAFQANVDADPPTKVTNAQGDVLEQYTLDPVNYRRYEPYVTLLESIDTERLAAQYIHYAPLLQQAYEDLGYPEGNFTDRLLEVIDQLLATPEVHDPVRLVKPEAYYKFVDPQLESLSAGQKLLIRMGYENASRVKDKLVEIRAALGG